MEGDAGTGQLIPTVGDAESPDANGAVEAGQDADDTQATHAGTAAQPAARRSSRLGTRGWAVGACATLVALSAAVATGGYFALRSDRDSAALAQAEAAAIQAAKDCVSATQAPDTNSMLASQQKIIDCATGSFGAQAALYSGVLVDAYQASKAQVQVSDLRAAVERHNPDGSMDVLVALRVKLSNTAAPNQEVGYRLRVQMAPDRGTYKIARLDQVTK